MASSAKVLAPLNQLVIDAPDMATAERQRRTLAPMGGKIVSRKDLSGLGIVLSTFRFAEDTDLEAAITEIKAKFPEATAEPNRRFRLLFSNHKTYAQTMLGVKTPSNCQQNVSLAMLDSAVNTGLSFLPPDRISVVDVTHRKGLSMRHGTGVATLMAADTTAYPGLLPNARLTAINVFAPDENDEPETRTDWLLYGLNALTLINPAPIAVNLSFGGDDSTLLKNALTRLSKTMAFIAAAGNDGSDSLVYPAAYPAVYAVGGVDSKGQKTRGSNYGNHLVMMAPGEDVWTSDADGNGYYASGTSFAAPFATVAVALAKNAGVSVDNYLQSLNTEKLIKLTTFCD